MNIKSILVPTDFSGCSGSALKFALFLTEKFKAEVIVLHVINRSHIASILRISSFSHEEIKKQIWAKHEEELNHFLAQNAKGKKIKSIICEGIPFQEIAKKAKELAVDLIVMGGYGRMGQEDLERIFFGSTAEKVIRLLPCPVLCVPESI
ncbi:MAG: Universal stress protein family protein [Candidatus Methanoperedenaceae archaeon GB50]|nr:MAG: Universal stress protein family protein [Candidatus Methanoperedenaceae archaeon GB50]HEC49624.1 universal stress protein [Candidatus Desulfofervidus auxilii]